MLFGCILFAHNFFSEMRCNATIDFDIEDSYGNILKSY